MTERRSFPGGYQYGNERREKVSKGMKKFWSNKKSASERKKAIQAGMIAAKKRREALGIKEGGI